MPYGYIKTREEQSSNYSIEGTRKRKSLEGKGILVKIRLLIPLKVLCGVK